MMCLAAGARTGLERSSAPSAPTQSRQWSVIVRYSVRADMDRDGVKGLLAV